MKNLERTKASLDKLKIIWTVFGFVFLFWLLESAIHVFVFSEGTFYNQLFYPEAHEFWMRSLVISLVFLFSIFAQNMVNIHRTAEEKIKRSHAELDQIFNTAADGMRVIDKNFNVLRINGTFSNIANVTMEEAIGKKCYEVFSGPLCHTPECPLNRIMNGEESVEYEAEKARKDGLKIPCIVYATPFKDPDGRLVGIVEDFRDTTERKKSEKEIEKLKKRKEFILGATKTGLDIIDSNFEIKYIDPEWEKIYGDAAGRKCYEYFMDREEVCPGCGIVEAMESGEPVVTEEVLPKEGNRQIQVTTIPFQDELGNQLFAEVNADITKRKMVEGALKESEQKYRSLIEKAPVGIILVDKQGEIININPKLLEILGSPSTDSTKSINVLSFPNLLEVGISEDVKFCVENEEPVVSEKPYTSKWGKNLYLRYHLTPVYDTEENLQGVQGIVEDITNRKKYEDALRESEGKLDAMLQSIGDHMSMMDKDLNIIWANDVAKQNFGEDIIGKKCYEVYHRRDKPCEPSPCLTLKAFEDGEVHEHETSVINREGEKRYFHCTANAAIRDDEGNPVGVIEISRDVTDQKLTEMSLEREMKINAAVANLSSTLLSPTSIEEMSNLVLEHAKHLTHSKVGYVGYIDPQTGYMISPTMKGEVWERCQVEDKDTVFKKFGGLWGWVLNNKEPILTNTPLEDPRSTGLPQGHIPVNRFLSVPATIDGELVGLISLANSQRDYTERDLVLVERLADLFAIAIKRKQTEDELQEERNKLEAIVGAIEYGMTIIDRDFNVIYQNKVIEDVFGDTIGLKCYQAFEGLDNAVEDCPVKLAFSDGKPHTADRKTVMESGEVMYWENTASPIKDAKGEILSCLVLVRDITERKKTEEALQEEKNKLEAIIGAINNGLSIQDREFNILYQNEEHKEIVGDRVGQKCYRAVHGRDGVCENCPLKQAFEDGKSHTVECEYTISSGELVYLENTASPIRNANGEIISCLEVVRDITNQKMAEKQIKKSLEEKEALLKEIHHRVKNNLQVISSLINLQSRYIKDEKILEVLKESQNRIKSMALVHEKMYQSEDLTEFDFTEYLRTLVSHLIHSYGCAGKVNLNMDIGEIYLSLDTAIPCSLIINELVSNSLKHAFPQGLKGEIDIKFHKMEDNGFKLVVSDNGIGFPEEMDYRNTDSLGLQLVNSLSKQLRGDISLYNDRGTTFEVIFPQTSKQAADKEAIR